MMSELQNPRWSVISERGREASRLTYEGARRLVHKLASEGRHGLCIITDQAASRISGVEASPDQRDIPAPA
jgi:hypothetical protein